MPTSHAEILETKVTGVCRFWTKVKGYGFIDWDGKSVFCHCNDLIAYLVPTENKAAGGTSRWLEQGNPVEFDVAVTEKGLRAMRVRVVNGGSK